MLRRAASGGRFIPQRTSGWWRVFSADALPSHVPSFSLDLVHYDLPNERIAKHPLPRGASRLLVVRPPPQDDDPSSTGHPPNGHAAVDRADDGGDGSRRRRPPEAAGGAAASAASRLDDCEFRDFVDLLPRDTHLLLNESRVVDARVWARRVGGRDTGGGTAADADVELMLLGPERPTDDPAAALSAPAANQVWRCMLRCEARAGDAVVARATGGAHGAPPLAVKATVRHVYSEWVEEGEAPGVEAAVELTLTADADAAATTDAATNAATDAMTMEELLARVGETPIPPYLHRAAAPSDRDDYQTVFAARAGSVAAPTAGLHLTDGALARLAERGVTASRLALHVSAGEECPSAWVAEG